MTHKASVGLKFHLENLFKGIMYLYLYTENHLSLQIHEMEINFARTVLIFEMVSSLAGHFVKNSLHVVYPYVKVRIAYPFAFVALPYLHVPRAHMRETQVRVTCRRCDHIYHNSHIPAWCPCVPFFGEGKLDQSVFLTTDACTCMTEDCTLYEVQIYTNEYRVPWATLHTPCGYWALLPSPLS